jgi:hypothetical protein
VTALRSAAAIARVRTFAFSGIEAVPVEVQVQISSGTPALLLVGLPDKAVGEARERMGAALSAMGLALPPRRVLINLAPADLLKEGSHFDLPITLGVLAAMEVVPREDLYGYAALGELSLDGTLNPVAGVLPAAIGASTLDLGLMPREPGRRGGLGGPHRGAGGNRSAVADQSFPWNPGADTAGDRGCCGGSPLAGSCRRQSDGDGEAGDRDRCRRRPR